MSPRAAWRLEALGFAPVYDYTAGKVDWLAAGLPTERAAPAVARVSLAMETDVPTCSPDEPAAGAADRARAAGWAISVALNDAGVVQGRVMAAAAPPLSASVSDVLDPGPATVRANEDLAGALQRMRRRRVAILLVTTPEGRLLGALRQPVAEHYDKGNNGTARA